LAQEAMKNELFDSAEVSDVGRKRKNNEDACLRIPEHGIYCVADGMGGQASGDLASEAIVTKLQEVFAKAAPEEAATFAQRLELFRRGVNEASRWIKNFSDEKALGQMGSTVVALITDPFNPARAAGLHAGDSRLYRYRGGELKQITADHSAVAALAAKLGRDPADIPAKYQNELLRCVGSTESVELELTPVDVRTGDVFLICSDGLTKMLDDKAIAGLLGAIAGSSVKTAAQALIDRANEAGGRDNVSVILVRTGDLSSAPGGDDADKGMTLTAPPPPAASDPAHEERPTADDATRTGEPATPVPSPIAVGPAESPVPEAPGKTGGFPIVAAAVVAGLLVAGAGAWWFLSRPATPARRAVIEESAEARPPSRPVTPTAPTEVAPAPEAPKPGPPSIVAPKSAAVPALAAADNEAASRRRAEEETRRAREVEERKLRLQHEDEETHIREAYRLAMDGARRSLGKHDYARAASLALEALGILPGDTGAAALRGQALRLAAQQETVRRFEAALGRGRDALSRGDYAGAARAAAEALAIRPGDAQAEGLREAARAPMEEEAARSALDCGEYEAVAAICARHASEEKFGALARAAEAERTALADANRRFEVGDYQFTASLRRQPFSSKPQFQSLLRRAAQEETLFETLKGLKDDGDWKAVLDKLADPTSTSWAGKPRFKLLAAKAERARLDATLETLLVNFGVTSPGSASLQTPEGRRAGLVGTPGPGDRDHYLRQVDEIEEGYRRGGWLEEGGVQDRLNDLRNAIAHR
jgi:serine/threonine protein phosphatase PrpC